MPGLNLDWQEPQYLLSRLKIFLYGTTKIGKTTWSASWPDAYFIETEAGQGFVRHRGAACASWADILEQLNLLASGGHPFKTVVVDTVDNMWKFCVQHILTQFKISYEGDLGYGKGFALCRNEFHRVLTAMSFLPMGIHLISHAADGEVEDRFGKRLRSWPTLAEKPAETVIGFADMVLFVDQEMGPDPATGKVTLRRVIRTKPSIHYEAGDRSKCLPETLPLSDYADFARVFEDGRARLGGQASQSAAVAPVPTATTGKTGKGKAGAPAHPAPTPTPASAPVANPNPQPAPVPPVPAEMPKNAPAPTPAPVPAPTK